MKTRVEISCIALSNTYTYRYSVHRGLNVHPFSLYWLTPAQAAGSSTDVLENRLYTYTIYPKTVGGLVKDVRVFQVFRKAFHTGWSVMGNS